ncbi:protein ANTI-SILENCING 1 [Diospyros lotus]|uniref:protein ANTI-SILENCING 1 n=1 Tax=Diospyros lotus TaxID=55363 RepID=UPI0022562312|nr:protein ANTI-SILENCING 1 [Diospyros lotus]XP_052203755.1 protein ANTI-SILENCING 1 [Diospyros lotus]XP_052203769.1 protein ANTI-SILENCING 1 [Diospyros lotus]XP_052203778.1 protein ANTI-SILENCING 1 [Diospyros lotus]XP_052203787.1 protein ANTI-SILENCING 1 [Diospyros lotus]
MPHLAETDHIEDLEFTWGKKRGVGGKNKDIRFYESFTYDGVEYALHDCVYMYKEGEPEPYIGKLTKIWETPDKNKKVKVQWFFHPLEISNWLGDTVLLEKEVFLASGKGVGAENVNPLGAIAGKCNVICISKDSRNRQPSAQELHMADYVFYRTFDVEHCTISDRIDDKVAGLEVNFVFNKRDSGTISDTPKLDFDKKEEALAFKTPQLSGQDLPAEFRTGAKDESVHHLVEKISEDEKDSLVGLKFSPRGKPASGFAMDSGDVDTASVQQGSISVEKATRYRINSDQDKTKMSKVVMDHVRVQDEVKYAKESSALENKMSKKLKTECSIEFSKIRNLNSDQKLTIHENNDTSLVRKAKPREDFSALEKGVKSEDAGTLDDRPSKKARVDGCLKLFEAQDNNDVKRSSIKTNVDDAMDLGATLTSKVITKPSVTSCGPNKDPKPKTSEKITKLSNGKLPNVSQGSPSKNRRIEGEVTRRPEDREIEGEVTQRPDDERSRWFRERPWDERMKKAYNLGTLVHLLNLDPEYTSRDVEDIIWQAFKEYCSAKMVQRTGISSPHSGEAFIILRTNGAANKIVKELDEGCLMLSNGRPLVGAPPPPQLREDPAFFGHLFIDRVRFQMQREMRDAVSTSHFSQPNTIEYEMAMEWRLLQSRSDRWWKQLYEEQGEQLRMVKGKLRRR